MRDPAEERFLAAVTADPTVRAVLERAPSLGLTDWWLTAGILFQAVWNDLTGRPPGTGIRDADFFYFDADTSWNHGYDDLFWMQRWPELTVLPWEDSGDP